MPVQLDRNWREYLYVLLIGIAPPLLTIMTGPVTLKSFIKRLIFFFVICVVLWGIIMLVARKIGLDDKDKQ